MTAEHMESYRLDTLEALARCLGQHLAAASNQALQPANAPEMRARRRRLLKLARMSRLLAEQVPKPRTLPLGPTPLSEAISTAIELWELRGMSSCLRLHWTHALQPSLPVWGNPHLLQQVFLHLFLRAEMVLASTDCRVPAFAVLYSAPREDAVQVLMSYGGNRPAFPPSQAAPAFQLCHTLLAIFGASLATCQPDCQLPWSEGLALEFSRFPQLGAPALPARRHAWPFRMPALRGTSPTGRLFVPREENALRAA